MRSLQSFGAKVRQIPVAMAARRVPDLFLCASVAVLPPVLIRTTKALLSRYSTGQRAPELGGSK